ncbi:MAG: porin [Pseudomonadota bacterium]
MMDLLKILRDKGTISEQDYQMLENAAIQETAAAVEKVDGGLVLDSGSSALKLKSADGNFNFQVGGRVMVDGAYYDEDKTELGSGAEIRRARLFAKGTVFHDWFYKAQVDFAGNEVTLKDFYMGYSGFDALKITLGNHKEPFSLEELTSSKYITFMERGLPNAFSPSRNTGISVSTKADRWGLQAGYYLDGINNENSPDKNSWGTTGRLHFAPLLSKNSVVHIGGAASYRGSGGSNEIRFRERPESHVTSTRLVNTGTITGYDNQTLFGAEAAAVFGPFSLQGEYMQTNVDNGGTDPSFNGWYVYGSYFLTGEQRPYKASNGTFGRVKPKSVVGRGGHGAWELAARYSSIDLTDSGIEGGKDDNLTLGVNWYATPNIRFMGNYIHASTDPTSVVEYPTAGDEKVNIFQVRGQIDF